MATSQSFGNMLNIKVAKPKYSPWQDMKGKK